VDFAEAEEHALLRSAVRDIGAGYGHAYFAEKSKNGEKAEELWKDVADHGFLAVHLPEEYGGGGAGMVELAIVCEELAAQGCPLLLMLVSPAICGELLKRFGTDAQKARWLRPMAAGEKMVFAITEPDAGSNSHNISTTATRDGDVYRLRGTKTFISGVDEAPSMVVVTRTGTDPDTGRARLSLFVVDTDAPRLERALIPVEISAPEKQFQLFFDDVEVPADRLLGDEGEGLRQVFHGLNPERIMSASICTGVGRYALGRAAEYANVRRVWDVPIGRHQGVAHPLAIAKIEVELARLMTAKAAWMHDQIGDGADDRVAAGEAANMAKYAAAEAGLRALDTAIQAHGGNGMASEYGLADLWGTVRLLRIAPVSREMVLNFVAQQSLGLPKSY
jgi:alkylation response protein AidB-like acyl-CoA dehydrogenase